MNTNKMLTRRSFIQNSLLAVGSLSLTPSVFAQKKRQQTMQIMTVQGAIDASQNGFTLSHEHIMSIFGGSIAQRAEYDQNKLFDMVIPYLLKLKALGLNTLCECTAAYFGRRADLLKIISQKTGIHILTNTGYYGAANDRYVPTHAKTENVDQLTTRWVQEWQNGIDNTGIRPGFIKIGVDSGPLSDTDQKLVRAAAQTHYHTGLTIASHTSGSVEAAQGQLQILEEEKVHPSSWIWVHAQNTKETDALLQAAGAGAWIELDGIREETLDQHFALLNLLKEHGHLNQVLLSHDGNSFRYGGRPAKPYEAIFTHFIPHLKGAEYTDGEIHQLTVENPRQAFTIRIRKA